MRNLNKHFFVTAYPDACSEPFQTSKMAFFAKKSMTESLAENLAKWLSVVYKLSGCEFESPCSQLESQIKINKKSISLKLLK